MNSEFNDMAPANNDSAFYNFMDSLTPSTLNLLHVSAIIPEKMESPDEAAEYLVQVVAPALQDAILQPEQTITQADAVAVGQTLVAVLSLAMTTGQARGQLDVVGAIRALSGFQG